MNANNGEAKRDPTPQITEAIQRNHDIAYLAEALAAGPKRYNEMIDGMREIYRRHGFDPKWTFPEDALEALKNSAPQTADLKQALRNHLSPEAIALVVAFLQVTEMYEPKTERQRAALKQVEWLAEALSDVLGADELARLLEDLGL